MKKLTLEEAKELFTKLHPEETKHIKESPKNSKEHITAACVWRGFKSALTYAKLLKE